MVFSGGHDQVVESVIIPDTVEVMNDLVTRKRSSHKERHHYSMFESMASPVTYVNHHVSVFVGEPSTTPGGIVLPVRNRRMSFWAHGSSALKHCTPDTGGGDAKSGRNLCRCQSFSIECCHLSFRMCAAMVVPSRASWFIRPLKSIYDCWWAYLQSMCNLVTGQSLSIQRDHVGINDVCSGRTFALWHM